MCFFYAQKQEVRMEQKKLDGVMEQGFGQIPKLVMCDVGLSPEPPKNKKASEDIEPKAENIVAVETLTCCNCNRTI